MARAFGIRLTLLVTENLVCCGEKDTFGFGNDVESESVCTKLHNGQESSREGKRGHHM